MAKITKLEKSQWVGNKFHSITILTDDASDYDPGLFQKVFDFLKMNYSKEIDKKASINSLLDVPVDRYFVDFQISDCSVMMDMDGFMFSIGFSKEEWRDKVFTKMSENFSIQANKMKPEKIVLYNHQSPDIKVSMEMYFNEKEELIFDGYDIGKLLEEYHGDSDYEYTYTISPEEVNKFYPIFGLEMGDRAGLLAEIQKRFGVNEAYSLFGEFMRKNSIEFKHFTWS